MADANVVQDNFLGGEWSPYARGRITDPRYKIAMSTCMNSMPMTTGAWVRRSGSRTLGLTAHGRPAKVIDFKFSEEAPYSIELTDGLLRLYDKDGPIFTTNPLQVKAISGSNPAQISTTAASVAPVNGQTVYFTFLQLGNSPFSASKLAGRPFTISGVAGNFFNIYDGLTGTSIDGSQLGWDGSAQVVAQIPLEFATPYTGMLWKDVRIIQDGLELLLLHPKFPPYVLTSAKECGNLFDFRQAQFVDGPYLDPYTDGVQLTPSAQTGEITLTLGYPAYSTTQVYANGTTFLPNGKRSDVTAITPIYRAGAVVSSSGTDYVSIADNNLNNAVSNTAFWKPLNTAQTVSPSGFQATDVGRLIRLLSEPVDWNKTSTYAVNSLVKYQDQYWQALVAVSANDAPGNNVNSWGIATNAATWTWGTIASVTNARTVVLQLQGGDLQYSNVIRVWQLGLYTNTGPCYPSCGTFHEGRIWLGGAQNNRFDASVSSQHFNMATTAPDGTVGDANAIAATFDSPDNELICFMIPDHQGIVAGTSAGEWLIQASAMNDPLTPTSIQAHRVTTYKCANIEAIRAGLVICFVQKFRGQLYEYICDLFSGRFNGQELSFLAKHLTNASIAEIAYVREFIPIVWMRCDDGSLIGTTYRRDSLMTSQEPTFNGWHEHKLGGGRKCLSISSGPSPDGMTDTLTMVTQDPVTGYCYVEQLTTMFQETDTIYDSWFLDSATVPSNVAILKQGGINYVVMTGYSTLEGQTVTAFLGGLDCGDFTVVGGTIYVPLDNPSLGPLTSNYLAKVTAIGGFGFETSFTITNNTPPQQTIQAFAIPADWATDAQGGSTVFGAMDWNTMTCYAPFTNGGQHSGAAGVGAFSIPSGALLRRAKNDVIYGETLPPIWDATKVYQVTTSVMGTDGNIYTAISGSQGLDPVTHPNTWGTGATIPGVFAPAHSYSIGDVVTVYTGKTLYFKALTTTTATNYPVANPSQWQAVGPAPGVPFFEPSVSHVAGTIVQTPEIGHIYTSTANSNVGHNPLTDGGVHWTDNGALPSNWQSRANYAASPIVSYGDQTWVSVAANNVGHVPNTDGGVHWSLSASLPLPNSGGFYYMGGDGNLFTETTFAGDGGALRLVKIDKDTLVAVASFLAPQMFLFLGNSCIDDEGNQRNFMCGTAVSGGVGVVYLYDTDRMVRIDASELATLNTNAFVVAGEKGFIGMNASCCCATADFYIIDQVAVNATVAGLWKVSINPQQQNGAPLYTMTKILDIPASSIDATWTKFTANTSLVFDTMDGNIITMFNNSSAAANHQNYMVKISAVDGHVMWATSTGNEIGAGFGQRFNGPTSRAAGGSFLYWPGVSISGYEIPMFQFNTITGALKIIDINSGVQPGSLTGVVMVTDAITGYLVTILNLTTPGTAPPAFPNLGPNTPNNWHNWATVIAGTASITYTVPGLVGLNYTSQGQILPPVAPETAGTRNGPALTKVQRAHQFGARLVNTGAISFGSDFDGTQRKAQLRDSPGKGAVYADNVLYSDDFWSTVYSDYSFKAAIAWEVTRPYPATLAALTMFLHTQDR